ncbi:MAG: hypothetical protein ABJC74_02130 [Gemmatimonadota bacterium]
MNCVRSLGLTAMLLPAVLAAQAAAPSNAVQIAGAVSPAPDSLKAGATVLGYDAAGKLVSIRQGTNNLLCLADNPSSKDFHPACYQKELEPFMARGRALRAQGLKRPAIDSVRYAEIMSGALRMPPRPTTLYEYYGKKENFDSATGRVTGASAVYVVYTPYATEESSGLSTIPIPGGPWLMYPGKPWAHIMIVPEKPKAADAK